MFTTVLNRLLAYKYYFNRKIIQKAHNTDRNLIKLDNNVFLYIVVNSIHTYVF